MSDMCRHVFRHECVGMRVGMCVGMCVGMYIGMCIEMCVNTCADNVYGQHHVHARCTQPPAARRPQGPCQYTTTSTQTRVILSRGIQALHSIVCTARGIPMSQSQACLVPQMARSCAWRGGKSNMVAHEYASLHEIALAARGILLRDRTLACVPAKHGSSH